MSHRLILSIPQKKWWVDSGSGSLPGADFSLVVQALHDTTGNQLLRPAAGGLYLLFSQ